MVADEVKSKIKVFVRKNTLTVNNATAKVCPSTANKPRSLTILMISVGLCGASFQRVDMSAFRDDNTLRSSNEHR